MDNYPEVKDPGLVGKYPALVKAGGGYVWDDLLEYRVWCHPTDGDDYFYAFETYEDALDYMEANPGSEEPIALILQKEYIDEPEPGKFVHITEERITEWPVGFLKRPRRTANTIPDFLSPDAPANRLDILRGLI
jgi:hypothetical protein